MNTMISTHPLEPKAAGARPAHPRQVHLGSYLDSESGCTRDVLAIARPDHRVLVIDSRPGGRISAARLVAHLAADEPPENTQLIGEMYLADEARGRCRALTREDLQGECWDAQRITEVPLSPDSPVIDGYGRACRIEPIDGVCSFPELRWTRSPVLGGSGPRELVTLREVVGAIEDYEPARSMTIAAITAADRRHEVSARALHAELTRLSSSPLVLNRGVREALQRTLARGEVSMSEIAIRCGRGKHSRRGLQSGGDTSWLERRVGLRIEGAARAPRHWMHTDVLALIARDGLGVDPHEVEV